MDDDQLVSGGSIVAADDEEEASCAICGRPMGESIDDRPDWPTGPMCGECYQSRQLDDEMAYDDQQADDDQ